MTDSSPSALPRLALALILVVSAAAVAFLFWLLYWHKGSMHTQLNWLPAFNAVLNSLSALCLSAGVVQIRAGRRQEHRLLMLSALGFSALFLISYILHHTLHGDTRFLGQGGVRSLYFGILISHVFLSIVVLPLVLTTAYLALSERFVIHRRWARWTFPLWLYVSVTGVAVYLLQRAYT